MDDGRTENELSEVKESVGKHLEEAEARQPYVAPTVTKWGSAEALTAGGGTVSIDGTGTKSGTS